MCTTSVQTMLRRDENFGFRWRSSRFKSTKLLRSGLIQNVTSSAPQPNWGRTTPLYYDERQLPLSNLLSLLPHWKGWSSIIMYCTSNIFLLHMPPGDPSLELWIRTGIDNWAVNGNELESSLLIIYWHHIYTHSEGFLYNLFWSPCSLRLKLALLVAVCRVGVFNICICGYLWL